MGNSVVIETPSSEGGFMKATDVSGLMRRSDEPRSSHGWTPQYGGPGSTP